MYALADVVVYPRRSTRTTALTTPLKPLEAMAMGKAVVASDLPALRELVSDEVTGLLFKAGDHCDLAAKCALLLADSAMRTRMGQAGRDVVVRERTWRALVSQYPEIYKDVLVRSQARGTLPKNAIDRVATPCQ
jgi:glycosyltransferase involved in cell wall biosynthesis